MLALVRLLLGVLLLLLLLLLLFLLMPLLLLFEHIENELLEIRWLYLVNGAIDRDEALGRERDPELDPRSMELERHVLQREELAPQSHHPSMSENDGRAEE